MDEMTRLSYPLSLSLTVKGNRATADLRYWEKDSISPSTLIFAAAKG